MENNVNKQSSDTDENVIKACEQCKSNNFLCYDCEKYYYLTKFESFVRFVRTKPFVIIGVVLIIVLLLVLILRFDIWYSLPIQDLFDILFHILIEEILDILFYLLE